MALATRKRIGYLALVLVTTLGFAVAYNLGMSVLEDRPQPLYRSLEVVVQSFTTTGYGEDAPWDTPVMNGLVIVMQFAGIALILAAVDVFAVPWLRDALSTTAPTAVDDVDDHVVVCAHTPRTAAFVDELEARDRPYVLVVAEESTAADLHESDYRVIQGDPESAGTLEAASLETARAAVLDAEDDVSASIALTAREVAPEIRILSLVEDAALVQSHRAAGVDVVLSPRQRLGERLASRVPTAVTAAEDGVAIGEGFELVEFRVDAESDLAGRTLAGAGLRERFGVHVVGAWTGDDFMAPVTPETELGPEVRLLVAGETGSVDALRDAVAVPVRAVRGRRIVLAGYGDSGRAAADRLATSDADLTVVDLDDDPDVDVVGDVRDPSVLEEAGIGDAAGLILTVSDDTAAILAALIARELNPDCHVVVRANEEADVRKLYRAGADYVQSLAAISPRLLVAEVYEDEEILGYEQRVRVVRLPARGLAGSTLAGAGVRAETGCSVIAVVRDGQRIADVDPSDFRFEADDDLLVAGTDDALASFEEHYVG